jgi:hypothetical protein
MFRLTVNQIAMTATPRAFAASADTSRCSDSSETELPTQCRPELLEIINVEQPRQLVLRPTSPCLAEHTGRNRRQQAAFQGATRHDAQGAEAGQRAVPDSYHEVKEA